MNFILASASPRRRELIKQIIPSFTAISTDVDENYIGSSPEDTAITIATRKAYSANSDINDIVISADTVVFLDGVYFGKPKDIDDAFKTLNALSNHQHRVVTGVAVLYNGQLHTFADVTKVNFKQLSALDIKNYISNYNVFDKAGGYAIQDNVVVSSYEGDYNNVVGLPVNKLQQLLKGLKIING